MPSYLKSQLAIDRRSWIGGWIASCVPLASLWSQSNAGLHRSASRRLAPPFRLPAADGRIRQLKDYRGKLLVLNFWATWCPPCRQEMPVLSAAQRLWRQNDVAIVGVAMDAQGWAKITPFLRQYPVDYEILLGNPQVARAYGAGKVYPTTVIVGPDGEIAGSIRTALDEGSLEQILTTLTKGLEEQKR